MAISDIVTQLVHGVKHRQDVDLNSIKREASRGFKVSSFASCATIQKSGCVLTQTVMRFALDKPPKLVEIIAAVPEEHRATLLPQ